MAMGSSLSQAAPRRRGNVDFNTTGDSGTPPRSPSVATGQGSGREFDASDPVRSFVWTFLRVLFSPRNFFGGMPPRDGFLNPMIFAGVCALMNALMHAVFNEVARALPGMQSFIYKTGFVSN